MGSRVDVVCKRSDNDSIQHVFEPTPCTEHQAKGHYDSSIRLDATGFAFNARDDLCKK